MSLTQQISGPKTVEDSIVELYVSGRSCNHIAKALGVDFHIVWRTLHKQGIKPERRYAIKRTTDVKTCNDTGVKAYIAGLLDSEGTIAFEPRQRRIGHSSNYYSVSIANTDLRMLQFILDNLGGKIVGMRPHPTRFAKKPIFQWKIQSFIDIKSFLEQIRPFLIRHRARAEEVIAFCRLRLGD